MASIGTDVSAQVASLLRDTTNGAGVQRALLAQQTGVAPLSLPPGRVPSSSAWRRG